METEDAVTMLGTGSNGDSLTEPMLGAPADKTARWLHLSERRNWPWYLQRVLADVPGGLVSAVVMMVIDVSAAIVIFDQRLPTHLGDGIALCLLCGAACPFMLYCFTKTECSAPFCCDAFVASLWAEKAVLLARAGAPSPFGTLAASMMMATLLLGAFFAALGHARVGRLLQFVPSPVLSGFLASMGYVQLDSLCHMSTGCTALSPACMAASGNVDQLTLALVIGLGLWSGKRLQGTTGTAVQQLMVPLMLLAGVAGLQVSRSVLPAGSTERWTVNLHGAMDARNDPSQRSPAYQSTLSSLLDALELQGVRWGEALWAAVCTFAAAALPSVAGRLLSYSAMELMTGELLDTSDEFTRLGIAQVATSFAVITPMISLPGYIVAHSLGARGKVAPALVAFVSALVPLCGLSLITAVPKPCYAGMLASIGLNFLAGELAISWRSLSRSEFCIVIAEVVAAATCGMLAAVVLGLLCCALIFAYDARRHSGVLQSATADLERSRVSRTPEEVTALSYHGRCTLIIHLHGILFFGSAAQVDDTVRRHVRKLAAGRQPPLTSPGSSQRLRFVILDCERCSAVDSTAASTLLLCQRQCAVTTFLVASAEPPILLQLARRGIQFLAFDTLDLALEHSENDTLAIFASTPCDMVDDSFVCTTGAAPSVLPTAHGYSPPLSAQATAVSAAGPSTLVPAQAMPAAAPDDAAVSQQERPWNRNSAEDSLSSVIHQSPSASALVVAYSPAEARRKLHAATVERMIERLRVQIESVYGISGLAEDLMEHMDILVVPPGAVIFDHSRDSLNRRATSGTGPIHSAERDTAADDLFIVESGFVSVTMQLPWQASAERDSVMGRTAVLSGKAEVHGSARLSYRIGKVSAGAVLGIHSFLLQAPDRITGAPVPVHPTLPTRAIADTFAKLLRMPARRYAELEAENPALACRLCRLLSVVSQRQVEEGLIEAAASKAFKVNVQPSASLTELLMGGRMTGGLPSSGKRSLAATRKASTSLLNISSLEESEWTTRSAKAESAVTERRTLQRIEQHAHMKSRDALHSQHGNGDGAASDPSTPGHVSLCGGTAPLSDVGPQTAPLKQQAIVGRVSGALSLDAFEQLHRRGAIASRNGSCTHVTNAPQTFSCHMSEAAFSLGADATDGGPACRSKTQSNVLCGSTRSAAVQLSGLENETSSSGDESDKDTVDSNRRAAAPAACTSSSDQCK